MIATVIVFTTCCAMFLVTVRAVIDPSFASMISSTATPVDVMCGLAVIAYLAAWSNNGDAVRACVGVAVLAVALLAATGGLTPTRLSPVGTVKAVSL